MGLGISVVIPTWQESSALPGALASAARFADEVIVADAGSTDGTRELARRAGARLIDADKGRGAQLHAGGCAARGDVLLFLHADARLGDGAREAMTAALEDPRIGGGNFLLRFVPERRWARFFSSANDLRRRWMRIYYGDSAIFLRRPVYQALGGFRPLPIFEDYELVRRLERRWRTAYIRDVVVTASARRFEARPMATLGIWVGLQALYMAGVSAERLAAWYRDAREAA